MYYEHFGLNYPPFKITPDTQLFYSGGNRGLVLDVLVYAIESGEGILKVVGEVGSGKTMLCRMLEERLPKRIEIVYIANPSLPPEMILHAIALEMRLPITPQDNRLQVMQALQTRLLEKHANNQQVVVFIEEAQGMPLETLEEIRLLSNLETTRHKLLQMVLFGQPELEANLSLPMMRQLKERITHSFYLEALTRKSIKDYLHFRMHAVGYRGPPVFSPTTIRILTNVSKGLIRRINILADKALLAAFAEDLHLIRPKHIRLAARDSDFAYSRFSTMAWVSLPIMLLLGLGFFLYKENLWAWFNSTPETTHPAVTEIPPNAPLSNGGTLPDSEGTETSGEMPKTKTPPDSEAVLGKISTITTDSLLQQRIQATEQWLAKANGQHYSIQVMQTKVDKTENLADFLRQPEMQPLLEDLYIHRVTRKEQVFWEVMYAEFANADNAVAAIATLPKILQRNQPFLRKIASLR